MPKLCEDCSDKGYDCQTCYCEFCDKTTCGRCDVWRNRVNKKVSRLQKEIDLLGKPLYERQGRSRGKIFKVSKGTLQEGSFITDRIKCNICKKWFVYAENSRFTHSDWLGEFLNHMEQHLQQMGITLK